MTLLDDALSYVYPAALRTAVQLCIADHLANGPMPVEQLARKAQADPDGLQPGVRNRRRGRIPAPGGLGLLCLVGGHRGPLPAGGTGFPALHNWG